MIRNVIILILLLVIVYDVTGHEFLEYVQIGLDNLQELVYSISDKG
jgi:hypothetical protein